MFNTKRIEALEGRVKELERGARVTCYETLWRGAPLDEVVALLLKHLGLRYEPRRETTSEPRLVKPEETGTTTFSVGPSEIHAWTQTSVSGCAEARQTKKRKGGKR